MCRYIRVCTVYSSVLHTTHSKNAESEKRHRTGCVEELREKIKRLVIPLLSGSSLEKTDHISHKIQRIPRSETAKTL